MEKLFGLPAHPLIVHIPVAMLPLAAVGVGVMLLRRAWYERYKWAVLGVGAIGTVGAFIATSSGEGLESLIRKAEGQEAVRAVHEHAEAGEMARNLAVLFFVALAAYVLVPWFLERRAASGHRTASTVGAAASEVAASPSEPRFLRPLLMAFVGLTAIVSMITIIDAGHSGADKAWEDLSETSQGD